MRNYKLKIDLPFLPKDAEYAFDDETAHVYRLDDIKKPFEFPLRSGLAGYLWLLLTERDKYFEQTPPEKELNP